MTPCSSAVQFFVDGQLVGEDKTAPYAIEWIDNNPFEAAEISVQVQDGHGNIARDKILLKPIDVSQSTSVQSVLLEPQVLDAKGRPVNGLKPENFRVLEDGVPQELDVAKPDAMPATYTLLIDTSGSMRRRIEFVREAAGKLPALLRPIDTRRRGAVLEDARRRHGTDAGRRDHRRRDRRDQADGRHGDSRLSLGGRRTARTRPRAGTRSSSSPTATTSTAR